MLSLIDEITAAFLGAIQAGGQALAVFMLPILGVCAVISWYREYPATVMSSGAGLGDALAHGMLLIFAAGCYLFLLTQLFTIAQAALDTVFTWGLLGAGGGVTSAQLRAPSFILEAGLKTARPIADFDTAFRAAKSLIKLAAHPGDLVAYWMIILAFIGITAHHMLMLIEYHLAVMLASVLIPWGIWRMTSGIAEFSLGWLTGGLIRALVSSALIGIATPLFELLALPVPGAGFFTLPKTFVLLGSSLIYLVLCWVIPAQAARLAGHASLGLTGSTLFHAASTTARFAIAVASAGRAASAGARVLSPMLRRG
jgi:type IV secretory pathway TrbL component